MTTIITDEFMRQAIPTAKTYSLVILKSGPNREEPGADKIVWEHARRNFALHVDGLLSIVCPVAGEGDVRGIGIFDAGLDETRQIMDGDPGVKAGIFVYELHPCRGFPGQCLP
jgi:hypothetical protein